MRNLIILFCFFLFTEGCKTYSYFKSPNDLLNTNCQVFLLDGTEIDGKLTVQFETGNEIDKRLKIVTNANTEKEILVKNVKYYKYYNDYYYPKELNLEAYEIPGRAKLYTPNVSNILFLKRLTNDSAKLQLFELFKSQANSSDGFDHYDYYLSFPNESRLAAWNIRGNKLFPDFAEKMSKIVSDCPSLAEKINQNENGYTLKQVSLDAKKYEVVKRIVEAYNKCK